MFFLLGLVWIGFTVEVKVKVFLRLAFRFRFSGRAEKGGDRGRVVFVSGMSCVARRRAIFGTPLCLWRQETTRAMQPPNRKRHLSREEIYDVTFAHAWLKRI